MGSSKWIAGVVLLALVGAGAVTAWSEHRDRQAAKDAELERIRQEAQLTRLQALEAERRKTRDLESRVADLEADADSTARDSNPAASPGSRADSFSQLESSLAGQVGVAFGPASGDGQVVLGSLSSGPAWSTMKVPVVIAALRAGGDNRTARAAITMSDNEAAMTLWRGLGTPTAAGRATDAVLRGGGNSSVHVQTTVTREGFTPFGQTNWTLADQQIFATRLPCIPGSSQVLDLMGQIDVSQRWGLGTVGANQRFKGGWGPDPSGAYLVRQFGLVDLPSGTVAVSIAAQPTDGTFEAGQRELNRLAEWVATNARGSATRNC